MITGQVMALEIENAGEDPVVTISPSWLEEIGGAAFCSTMSALMVQVCGREGWNEHELMEELGKAAKT